MIQPHFEIGDRVVSTGWCGRGDKKYFGKHLPNYSGTIIDIVDGAIPPILVEFDEFIEGHSGNGLSQVRGKEGHCYFCFSGELIPEDVSVNVKFSFDDFIIGEV